MKKIIVNLTQHKGTPEQGVLEPELKEQVKDLLTFDEIPSRQEMESRAKALLKVVHREMDCHALGDHAQWCAMIGGAPFFMPVLERVLAEAKITPLYAFSRRESVEEVVDGKVVKKAVFRHIGFVEGTVN
jgi:hypothetical protein